MCHYCCIVIAQAHVAQPAFQQLPGNVATVRQAGRGLGWVDCCLPPAFGELQSK